MPNELPLTSEEGALYFSACIRHSCSNMRRGRGQTPPQKAPTSARASLSRQFSLPSAVIHTRVRRQVVFFAPSLDARPCPRAVSLNPRRSLIRCGLSGTRAWSNGIALRNRTICKNPSIHRALRSADTSRLVSWYVLSARRIRRQMGTLFPLSRCMPGVLRPPLNS